MHRNCQKARIIKKRLAITLKKEVKQLLKVIFYLFAHKIFLDWLEGNIAYSETLEEVSNCEYKKTI